MNSDRIIQGATQILHDVSTIILGAKKDGTPRSIIDAKIDLEKAKAKRHKNKRR